MNIEMSIELYNGKKSCNATFSCHDLDKADGFNTSVEWNGSCQ